MARPKFNLYYSAFLALGLIWETNFLFMKWAAVYITPLQIVFLRVAASFIPVFLYALIRRQMKLTLKGMGDIQTDAIALLGVVVGLGVIGTGLAYILYYVIVKQLGAVIASTVTYIPPVVSLLIGAFLTKEIILISDWIAMMIILLGVYTMNKKSRFSRAVFQK